MEYYRFEDINYSVLDLFRYARRSGAAGTAVLDLGCGRARLGLELEKSGLKVAGVDIYGPALEKARDRITEVIEMDLTNFAEAEARLARRQFDWLLAADVLEHTSNPQEVLSFYRRFLKPDGYLIVSVPNVVVWDNRLRLLAGRFTYADSGVMDRRHLRFFTFRSARQLLVDSGFVPVRRTWQEGIVRAVLPLERWLALGGNAPDPGALLESPLYKFYVRYVRPVEHVVAGIAPGLLAFRVVQLARRGS